MAYIRFTMRIKIFLFCTSAILAALLIEALLFNLASSKIIYLQEREASRRSVINMHNSLSEFTRQLEKKMYQIYTNPELLSDLGSGKTIDLLSLKYRMFTHDFAVNDFEASQSVVAMYLYRIDDKPVSLYRHASTPIYNYPDTIFTEKFHTNSERVKDIASWLQGSMSLDDALTAADARKANSKP